MSSGGFSSAVLFVAWRDWLRLTTGYSLSIWSIWVSGTEEVVFDEWYEEPMLMLAMLLGMARLSLLPLLLRLGRGVVARDCL